MATEKMQVEKIVNGTVIDHIPAGAGLRILNHLSLTEEGHPMTIGFNLVSKSMGRKDIIKIENRFFTDEEANQLALFAGSAPIRINVIRDYGNIKKIDTQLPEAFHGVFSCPNSNCITHVEPVKTIFKVSGKDEDIRLSCHFCEKSFPRQHFR